MSMVQQTEAGRADLVSIQNAEVVVRFGVTRVGLDRALAVRIRLNKTTQSHIGASFD
jgi:hypothetical protein